MTTFDRASRLALLPDLLRERILVLDGAMGTMLQAHKFTEADFRGELSGGELDLVLAEQTNDQTAIDAAKIQIEHESLYTDDDKVNAVLIAQHDRAEKEIMRMRECRTEHEHGVAFGDEVHRLFRRLEDGDLPCPGE